MGIVVVEPVDVVFRRLHDPVRREAQRGYASGARGCSAGSVRLALNALPSSATVLDWLFTLFVLAIIIVNFLGWPGPAMFVAGIGWQLSRFLRSRPVRIAIRAALLSFAVAPMGFGHEIIPAISVVLLLGRMNRDAFVSFSIAFLIAYVALVVWYRSELLSRSRFWR